MTNAEQLGRQLEAARRSLADASKVTLSNETRLKANHPELM
jgi:hypothetical protein